jgi:hypothetical protein
MEVRSQTFLSVSTFILTSANEQIMYTYITKLSLIHLLLLKFVGKLSSVGYENLHKRKKFYVCPVPCIVSVTAAIMQVRFFTSVVLWNKHPNLTIAYSQSDMLPMALFS